jgi:hypothetical protein
MGCGGVCRAFVKHKTTGEAQLPVPHRSFDENPPLPTNRRAGGSMRYFATRSIVTVFMTTGVSGRSFAPVLTLPIFFTTSRPSTTSPKIV